MHRIMLIYDIPMTCALKTVAVMQGHYRGNSYTCHGLCTLVLQRQVLMYSYAQFGSAYLHHSSLSKHASENE